MFRFANSHTPQFGPSVVSLRLPPLRCRRSTSLSHHSVSQPTSCSLELDHFRSYFPNPQKMFCELRLGRASSIKKLFSLARRHQLLFLLVMSHNFTLSPEDCLLWQRRAPHASWWLGVSDHHPFINGGQPIPPPEVTLPPYGMALPPTSTTLPPPGAIPPPFQTTLPPLGTILPPPPYTSAQLPAPPTSASQPYLASSQPSILGATSFLPGNLVPIYDVHHQNNRTHITTENTSFPSRKLNFNLIYNS